MKILDYKWGNYRNKLILIFSLINFFILLYSIFIDKKNSHKYKIVAISYANHKFLKQVKINKFTALNVGKVDEYYNYKPDDIDIIFLSRAINYKTFDNFSKKE